MRDDRTNPVLPLLVVGLLLWLLMSGGGIEPVPPEPVEPGVMASAFEAYRVLSADAFSDLAARLKAGELKTDRDTAKAMQAATETARKAAFAKLPEVVAKGIGEEWTAEKSAAVYQAFADELRKCKVEVQR